MRRRFSVAAVALLWSIAAHANSTKVVIGDIDDMSGPYADTNGPARWKQSRWPSPTSAVRRSAKG